jgi:hypothetical protein
MIRSLEITRFRSLFDRKSSFVNEDEIPAFARICAASAQKGKTEKKREEESTEDLFSLSFVPSDFY